MTILTPIDKLSDETRQAEMLSIKACLLDKLIDTPIGVEVETYKLAFADAEIYRFVFWTHGHRIAWCSHAGDKVDFVFHIEGDKQAFGELDSFEEAENRESILADHPLN